MDRSVAAVISSTVLAGGIAMLIAATVKGDYQGLLVYGGFAATIVGGSVLGWLLVTGKTKEAALGDEFTINNHGSGVAIGKVETLNLGHQRLEMNVALMAQIASNLDKNQPVALFWVSTGRSPSMVAALEEYLVAHGFTIGAKTSWDSGPFTLDQPVVVSPNGLGGRGIRIAGGSQVVGIDASLA